MPGWEYKTLIFSAKQGHVDGPSLEEMLNELGEDGWELISVSPVLYEGNTLQLVHHFQRAPEPTRRVGFQA